MRQAPLYARPDDPRADHAVLAEGVMREPRPVIQTMTMSDVRAGLDSLVSRVHRGEARVVVELGGLPVAVLVSTEDLERLARLDRARDERFAVVDDLRTAFADGSDEEIERETDRILAENREETQVEGTNPAPGR